MTSTTAPIAASGRRTAAGTQAATDRGRPPGLDEGPVYLDYNGTTPVDTRVVDALLPYLLSHFGNPSSSHHFGAGAAAGLTRARAQVASLINVPATQVTFTGSGSEADALAIRGVVLAAVAAGNRAPHLITQATEHPAVLAACRAAATENGARVTVLPVDRHGLVDPEELRRALTPQTVLVSIMHANNETGTLQPVAELAAVARAGGALFHTDAAQTTGKIPLDATALGVDLLTLVGHKMYAPKGVAALYVREGTPITPIIGGGGQERGLRAGTENVPYAVALGAAADLAASDLDEGAPERLAALRDRLHARLEQALPGRVHLNGHPEQRLPQTLNVSVEGVLSHEVLSACTQVAASAGSACHAGQQEPSPVLTAMGLPSAHGLSALRLTLGRWTTAQDVDEAGEALVHSITATSASSALAP